VNSPESWVCWYFEAREDSGAKAIDLVSSRGWIYAKKCGAAKCKSETRHSTKEGFYVCGACGAIWPFTERYSLKGEVQSSPRTGHFESAISRLVDVGCAFNQLVNDPKWKWKGRLFVAHAMGWSYNDLLDDGPVAWKDAPPDIWTHWKVRSSIHAARREWRRLLRVAGIETTD